MLDILDHIGLFAFAISGVLTAANRNFDALGGFIIAFITALGGGTIRDILLNDTVAWTTSSSQIAVVIIAATVGIVLRKWLKKWKRMLFIFDTVGIATFTIIGVQKGLDHEQLYIVAIFLGMITATFGGLLRDVLCNEIPLIFREEMYAIPCLAGGMFYLLGGHFGLNSSFLLLWSSILFIIIFRTLAVVFSWKSPLMK